MVSLQVIDENQSLFLILTRFLHVFREGNGKENNVVAMVTCKISSQIFSISQREAYPFLLKQGWISSFNPIKGIKFKEFKELKKVLSYSRVKYFKI